MIPMIGKSFPHGTLKERGALGSLLRRISTSICANMYEIIQKTDPTKIKKEIASDEPLLRSAKRKINALTKITPKRIKRMFLPHLAKHSPYIQTYIALFSMPLV